ncbi:TetR/AcrR family transcriptional regulator [Streptosporangium carneum]|uniref:TetR/AcrR family transcriptional regulator n=1 Tax=Streptosporangium carneum TaxID=47481 RepID=UPI0022F2DA4D|nr:TetR/AcrR family transcriptional regulator [Streptosporangium carneum]
MSPRRADPRTRPVLVDIAARLLAEEGPQALSTRRLATEADSSTMAVYTHFGGMSGLVREMVHEGFARLQRHLTHVRQTDDPVADMALLGRAYRHNALANPHLYAVMFGGSSLAGFSLTEEDRQHGRYTLGNVVKCATRCFEAGRFRAEDAELVAHQMWSAIHGLVTLELGDYLIAPYDADRCFEAQLTALMVSSGDALDAAASSVALSRERMRDEVEASGAAGEEPAAEG